MYMKQDWLMRQIEVVGVAIARLVFGKGELEHELTEEGQHSGTDLLRGKLSELFDQKKFGQVEDLLFEYLDPDNLAGLSLALDFYRNLNGLSDEELERGNFPREEIAEGLCAVMDRFGVYLPGLL